MEYQSKYFENDLIFMDITEIRKIKEEKGKLKNIKPNKTKINNE